MARRDLEHRLALAFRPPTVAPPAPRTRRSHSERGSPRPEDQVPCHPSPARPTRRAAADDESRAGDPLPRPGETPPLPAQQGRVVRALGRTQPGPPPARGTHAEKQPSLDTRTVEPRFRGAHPGVLPPEAAAPTPIAPLQLLAQEPAQGKTANASGATTGATEWITRLSVSSAVEDRPHGQSQSRRRRSIRKARWPRRGDRATSAFGRHPLCPKHLQGPSRA